MAGITLVAGFIVITLAVIFVGTVHADLTAFYILLVIIAGLLFHLPGILAAVAASSLVVFLLIKAEHTGLLVQGELLEPQVEWMVYTLIFTAAGLVIYISNIFTKQALDLSRKEIRDRERAEAEMKKLLRAVEQSPSSIVITDLAGKIEYVNPLFTLTTGYTLEESIGQNPRILKTDLTPPETHRQLWANLTAGMEWRGEFINRKKDGSIYYESANISPILDAQGQITHYLAVKDDITERKLMEEAMRFMNEELVKRVAEVELLEAEMRHLALHDPLTGLFNRRYLLETLPRELARCERESSPLSLVLMDIDHFKRVNDTYGHVRGDEILVAVAQVLKDHIRTSDLVCRYGGEEFLVVLPGASGEIAVRRAETLRLLCNNLVVLDGDHEIRITVSFGVKEHIGNCGEIEKSIKHADQALYHSKQTGRNRVSCWSEDMATASSTS